MTTGTTIVEAVEAALLADREEGSLNGENCASEAAVAKCKEIVAYGDHRPTPDVRWTAFGEDGGGACIVVRSQSGDRRVDIRVAADGTTITAIRVDENMEARTLEVCPGPPTGVGWSTEALAWWASRGDDIL